MRKKERVRGRSVIVMEYETEENSRDMFDENNEGYKGRDKTVHGQQEIYMKE